MIVVYCIVTCSARDYNQSRPNNNPTWWQRCSAWRVLQPRKRNKGEEGGEGTYHRHPNQAFATRINHRNEVAAENGRGRQEKGTARVSVRARKSPAAGEERVLPPGRKESCRRGGKSPAAGEERVLPPGRRESCRLGGENPAAGEERFCRRGVESGEERVLPPGRRESCRRGGESPAAGEVRVLPPGRRESCRRGGKSPAAGEERVRPPGRKESGRLGGKSLVNGEERVLPPGRKEREPPYKRERAREYVTQGEAYARECMSGKAGGQRRDRSKRVHGVKTVEKN